MSLDRDWTCSLFKSVLWSLVFMAGCLAGLTGEITGEDLASRRQEELPTEEDMVVMEGSAPEVDLKPKSDGMAWMPGRLAEKLDFWVSMGASGLVQSWIALGFMPWFSGFPPAIRIKNQESCYQPAAQHRFVSASIDKLLAKGVIAPWNSDWGEPRVVSSLKVVPKKGKDLFRLILDLSRLNKWLVFPRFRYDSILQVQEVFEQGDLLFSWDLKDGYWHCPLHPDFWTYCCCEWEGTVYYWAQLPFGLAPACWVFTTLVKVLVSHLRSQGLRCLAYIDDGLGGAHPLREARRMAWLVVDTFTRAGFILNCPG